MNYFIQLLICLFMLTSCSYLKNDEPPAVVNNNHQSYFQKSTAVLPLMKSHQHIDFYSLYKYDHNIEALSEWDCGEPSFRYLPLPAKDDIDVILVPMDCGDFPYRLYLLTIKDSAIRSNLYVEGEWHEMGVGSAPEIEKTQFSIAKDYVITVQTTYFGATTVEMYALDSDGYLKKINNK